MLIAIIILIFIIPATIIFVNRVNRLASEKEAQEPQEDSYYIAHYTVSDLSNKTFGFRQVPYGTSLDYIHSMMKGIIYDLEKCNIYTSTSIYTIMLISKDQEPKIVGNS